MLSGGKTKIGELDREITFIQPIIEQGTSNEDKITGWEEIDTDATVNAKKKENSGAVYVQADRLTYAQQTTWTIRHRTDLNVTMRVVWDTKVYQISNISDLDEGRQRYMALVTNLLDNVYFT